jgi:hypothetical protein
MIPNMHTPENVRALRAEVDRPDRAVVEAAFQTITRWTDDDPERDGLIDTHARVARAFEEFFVGCGQDPVPTIIGRALPRASQCGTQHFPECRSRRHLPVSPGIHRPSASVNSVPVTQISLFRWENTSMPISATPYRELRFATVNGRFYRSQVVACMGCHRRGGS